MDKKTILIVDDEKEIADLLRVYLRNEGFEVTVFYRGSDAWDFIQRKQPDLAILDVMLPDLDGFALCRRIREHFYFPVIMLTAKIEQTDKINGIMLGADDYITKPFLPLEMIARVKGQLRRAGQYNPALERDAPECYEIRGLEVYAAEHRCLLYGRALELTPTEFAILLYLCRHLNQVVTAEDIFEQVWREKFMDSNNTVFTHISRIREKMHENARKPEYIKTVWGVGYKLEE